ncbi:MAG: nucleotide exchange factor GrpE, partial [Thermodesulfobacteriota bacterium]
MRIPITTGFPEDLRRRDARYSLRGTPRFSDGYGYRRGGSSRGVAGPSMQNRTNLAVDREIDWEEEGPVDADKEAVQEEQVPVRKKDAVRAEAPHEDWKERYIRLRADFDNYKRNAEAQREKLSGMGKARVLEDIFPLVEHMERAIRAARDAGDRTGILQGIEMVYQELLRVLEKNGVERIETVGKPFDPEIHEAVAVSPHPDYPADTV